MIPRPLLLPKRILMDPPNNCSARGSALSAMILLSCTPFPKKLYFKMVEGCYMSALTSLSEEA